MYTDAAPAPHVMKGDLLDLDFTMDMDHRKRRRNRTTQSCLNCHTSKRKVSRHRRVCNRMYSYLHLLVPVRPQKVCKSTSDSRASFPAIQYNRLLPSHLTACPDPHANHFHYPFAYHTDRANGAFNSVSCVPFSCHRLPSPASR
jgi:hypothetical protein